MVSDQVLGGSGGPFARHVAGSSHYKARRASDAGQSRRNDLIPTAVHPNGRARDRSAFAWPRVPVPRTFEPAPAPWNGHSGPVRSGQRTFEPAAVTAVDIRGGSGRLEWTSRMGMEEVSTWISSRRTTVDARLRIPSSCVQGSKPRRRRLMNVGCPFRTPPTSSATARSCR